MPQSVIRVTDLPHDATGAAAAFYARWSERIGKTGDCSAIAVVLTPVAYDHRDWRLAAVRDLARAAAPIRVNFIAGGATDAVRQTLDYLARAAGVTGQYFELTPSS